MYEFEDMVNVVQSWFRKEKPYSKQQFLDTPKENLVSYHSSLGRAIRNEFKLWDVEWVPEIREGVDYSAGHPDQVSMQVIEEVWRRLQNS